MTILSISTWSENHQRQYRRQSTRQAMVEQEGDLSGLVQQLAALVVDQQHGGARGINFGLWRGVTCESGSLLNVHAACLNWNAIRTDEVAKAVEELGARCLLLTTEDKRRTTNAITLVIPYASPVTVAVSERVVSCLAKRFDIYSMITGSLAAVHIANIHGTTQIFEQPGYLFDADAFKQDTSRLYQEQDAKKYYLPEPPMGKAATAQIEKPVFTHSNNDLFAW